MKIKLNNVRLSFPSLFQRAVFNGQPTDNDKFEATFLIDKESQAELIEKIKSAIATKIKDDLKGAKIASDKICLKDGDTVEYDGYQGHYSIKAANRKRPLIIDADKSPLTEDDNRLYAGCYVNAIIELWSQNNSYGKRINANLLGVQFAKDGEPFGDGVNASVDDFDFLDGVSDGDNFDF